MPEPDPEPPSAAEPPRPPRTMSREARRAQIIEATIRTLAARGLARATLTEVARTAGLSHGLVLFHFDSKEGLLAETLSAMAEEYRQNWQTALAAAGPSPAEQLAALIEADFAPAICTPDRLAAWCAFWGEAKSRPTYQALCGARDEAYQQVFVDLCTVLKSEGDYAFEPKALALALSATLEGLWHRLMMGTENVTRETSLQAAAEMLACVFPRHYARGPSGVRRAVPKA